jgi:type II secretion system protein D
LRVRLSFFIIISLILSFYFIPFALAENAGQDMEEGTEELVVPPSEVKPAGAENPAPPKTEPQRIKQPVIEPQKPEAGQTVPVESEKVPVPTKEVAKPQIASGTVSFFFDDADIFEVVQTVFGEVLRVNYVIDPRVKGRVNFRTVTPIPRDEVLPVMEIILRLNGIGFVEEKGLYNIVPLDEVSKELVYAQVGKPPENVAIELFTFKNLNLKDSMADIENALGLSLKGGMVRILPVYQMNALIVVASNKEQLEYIRKWVELFDNMFSVARPKIFVYALQNSKADHIASLLQSIFSGGGAGPSSAPAPRTEVPKTTGTTSLFTTPKTPTTPRSGASTVVTGGTSALISPETKIFADDITNSLIILSTPTDYEFIKETIQKIDIMPRQVVIEGLIASVTLTDNLDFGIQWMIQNNFTIKGFKPFNNDINIKGPLELNTPINSPTFTFTALDAAGNVKLLLQALASQGRAKVLAAPHILVSDNREARIQVGSQVPLATSTTSSPIIGTETTTTLAAYTTIQYKDIGIILKVKPQVNDSGLVSLEIDQEISSLGGNVVIAGQNYQSIDKTESTTNLVSQDGETIIIGGLIREDVTKSRAGIPFLSRIPILGYLFGNTIDETKRTELIILLTPHVMRNQQEAGAVTTDYLNRYKGTTKDKAVDQFIKEKKQKEKSSGNAETKDAK